MKRREVLLTAAALLITTPLLAQSPGPVHVATYFETKSASTKAGATLITQYARAARADAGNTAINALQEIGRSNRFVVISSWQDQAAFAAHEKATHTQEFRNSFKAMQGSPYDQRLHTGFAIDPQPQTAGANTLYAVTHVDVPGPRRAEAEALLKQLYEPSRVDAGHVRYDLYQQHDPRTNHFTVFAAWDSQRAFDAYGSTPHWLQFREALAPMLGALYDERLYRALKL